MSGRPVSERSLRLGLANPDGILMAFKPGYRPGTRVWRMKSIFNNGSGMMWRGGERCDWLCGLYDVAANCVSNSVYYVSELVYNNKRSSGERTSLCPDWTDRRFILWGGSSIARLNRRLQGSSEFSIPVLYLLNTFFTCIELESAAVQSHVYIVHMRNGRVHSQYDAINSVRTQRCSLQLLGLFYTKSDT
jgi:hypothetical protein